jgi:hypothetical protein
MQGGNGASGFHLLLMPFSFFSRMTPSSAAPDIIRDAFLRYVTSCHSGRKRAGNPPANWIHPRDFEAEDGDIRAESCRESADLRICHVIPFHIGPFFAKKTGLHLLFGKKGV